MPARDEIEEPEEFDVLEQSKRAAEQQAIKNWKRHCKWIIAVSIAIYLALWLCHWLIGIPADVHADAKWVFWYAVFLTVVGGLLMCLEVIGALVLEFRVRDRMTQRRLKWIEERLEGSN